MKSLKIFTALLALTFIFSGSILAQDNLISINLLHGKVINSVTNAPVQDGKLKIINTNSGQMLAVTTVRGGNYQFKNIVLPNTDGIKIMMYANDDYERPVPGPGNESDAGIKIMMYANDDYDGPTPGFAHGVTLNFANVVNGVYHLDLLADGSALPVYFSLNQNYPNPFNPATTISFVLPSVSSVTLKIYDMHGKEVASLYNNETVGAGLNQVQFNAENLSSGIYFYSLNTGSFSDIKKMTLIK